MWLALSSVSINKNENKILNQEKDQEISWSVDESVDLIAKLPT